MRRKTTAILLLFLLLAPVIGSFCWLHIQKTMVRREIKWRMIDGISLNELVLIQLTPQEAATQLAWEHSREFEYGGEMYDVVKHEATKDSLYYWCWWDHEETVLNQKLLSLTSYALHHNDQRNHNEERLIDFFKTLYFVKNVASSNGIEPMESCHSSFFSSHYLSLSFSPPSPPPKLG